MKIVKYLVYTLLLSSVYSCSYLKQEEKKEYPKFWTWLDYRPGMNFDSVCVVMKETGLDGLILNAPTPDDYRLAIPIANKYGIEVYAWLWTLNIEHGRNQILNDHPEWFSVNRRGESLADTKAYVDYYKFVSPSLPEVREYIRKKIIAYCEVEGLNGIVIDYHRLVDVILPTTLWSRYGIVQDKEYPEWDYGYHPEMIRNFMDRYGYNPTELDDPSKDEKWLQFRCDQVTEVANEISKVVHSYGKVMAASPFPTPAMSRAMVRQDWGKWNLDIVFPMVYHNFYTGDVSFIEDCTIDNMKQKNPNTTLYCGMTGTNSMEMFESMDAAFNNGAEGVSIFTINNLKSPEMRSRFKVYADSIRSLSVSDKNKSAYNQKAEVITNPFAKQGVMDAIEFRIRAYLSLDRALHDNCLEVVDLEVLRMAVMNAMQVNKSSDYMNNLIISATKNKEFQYSLKKIWDQFEEDLELLEINLGEYNIKDEYETTKIYEVTDLESMTNFIVTFYFYGNILSGWSVEPYKEV